MVAPTVLRDLLSIVVVLALLVAVSLLPPDVSLREVEDAGALKACVPSVYPPLVTGDPARPGIDVELLEAVAGRLGVGLLLSENSAIGRDFNPRNWGLNRAQCQVVAGGVVDSDQTRSFLETGPSYAHTGWAIVSPRPIGTLRGRTIGALTLISGLDRIELATLLRAEGVAVRVVASAEALVTAISDGTLDAGITEALMGAKLAADNGWTVEWAPPALARYHLVFGLWKGDITLKQAIERAFADLEADGTVAQILKRYGVVGID